MSDRAAEVARHYARFDELTDAEIVRLVVLDPIGMLCRLVKDAGLTMRLHGVPIEAAALREHCTEQGVRRIVNALESASACADKPDE